MFFILYRLMFYVDLVMLRLRAEYVFKSFHKNPLQRKRCELYKSWPHLCVFIERLWPWRFTPRSRYECLLVWSTYKHTPLTSYHIFHSWLSDDNTACFCSGAGHLFTLNLNIHTLLHHHRHRPHHHQCASECQVSDLNFAVLHLFLGVFFV